MGNEFGYVISNRDGTSFISDDTPKRGVNVTSIQTDDLQEAHVFRSATEAAKFLFSLGAHNQPYHAHYTDIGWEIRKVKREYRLVDFKMV